MASSLYYVIEFVRLQVASAQFVERRAQADPLFGGGVAGQQQFEHWSAKTLAVLPSQEAAQLMERGNLQLFVRFSKHAIIEKPGGLLPHFEKFLEVDILAAVFDLIGLLDYLLTLLLNLIPHIAVAPMPEQKCNGQSKYKNGGLKQLFPLKWITFRRCICVAKARKKDLPKEVRVSQPIDQCDN